MSKKDTFFVCSNCGFETLKWQGKCDSCGAWNSLTEQVKELTKKAHAQVNAKKTSSFAELAGKKTQRISTGMGEFDRALGGGLVPASFVLLGGEPGIGKSTLALQLAANLSANQQTLYISGEESFEQVALRAQRVGFQSEKLEFLAERNLEVILESIVNAKAKVVVLDSIQTISSLDLPGVAGSISQVRECTERLLEFAKGKGITIILIGHVTKDGSLAGPKTMEHLVDTVLYLEGEREGDFRILKSSKNRFGPVNEVGVFEMREDGLQEVVNSAESFLSKQADLAPGACITAVCEGSRTFFVEIQALTTTTNFGYPKRLASGFSLNRLQLIIAILTRHAGLKLDNKDVYLKVSGGFKIDDPAADLAVALAICSASQGKALDKHSLALGELALSGEVRKVRKLEQRLKEAERLGYRKLFSVEAKGLSENIRIGQIPDVLKLFS
ncbi:MAG: DNA repair protein RadA [Candidatus Gracilibacteria bacterium]|nr:DNA repair protein RadA [Candidatus Gracilibacteria bacterium]